MDWQQLFMSDYSTWQLIAIGCTLVIGTLLQSIVGFGFSLLAMPVLLRLGIELPESIVFSMIAQLWQQGGGVYHLRRNIVWPPLAPVMAAGVCFLGLGVLLNKLIATWDQDLIRQIIGVLIMTTVLVQWFWKPGIHEQLHFAWGALAGAFAGLMCGVAGIPGPPVVLWIMAHTWSNRRLRGSIWAIFLSFSLIVLVMLWISFGKRVTDSLVPAAMFIPIVHLANMLGLYIGGHISKRHLRQIMFVLLLLVAVATILL